MIFEKIPPIDSSYFTYLKAKNPDYESHIREKLKKQRFMHHLELDLSIIKPGYIECPLEIESFHLQQLDFVHGGVLATMCDVSAGFAAFSLVEKEQGMVTADLRVSYLNPATEGMLLSRGWVLKPGSRLYFCESDIWQQKHDGWLLICKSSATMAVVNPEDIKK